ncbi:uncharacterized protein LOC135378166 isoform X2 [Ornithodoros turicata]|uniref:uncharacterized protein LOC135378166 isoform X2 n=1 Tax=Ornithodoros turicata TaxID=34597 RepID=UPI003138FB18
MVPVDGRTVLLVLTLLGCATQISCKRRKAKDVPGLCQRGGIRVTECKSAFHTDVEMTHIAARNARNTRNSQEMERTNCTLYSKLECCLVTEYGVLGCSDKNVIQKAISNAIANYPGYESCPRGLCDPSMINGSVRIMRDMDENLHGREAVSALKKNLHLPGRKVKREVVGGWERGVPRTQKTFVEEHLRNGKHKKNRKGKKGHKKSKKQDSKPTNSPQAAPVESDVSKEVSKEAQTEVMSGDTKLPASVEVTPSVVNRAGNEVTSVQPEKHLAPSIHIEVKKKLSDIGKNSKKTHRRKKHRKSKTKTSTAAPLQNASLNALSGMSAPSSSVPLNGTKEGKIGVAQIMEHSRDSQASDGVYGKVPLANEGTAPNDTTAVTVAIGSHEDEHTSAAGEKSAGTEESAVSNVSSELLSESSVAGSSLGSADLNRKRNLEQVSSETNPSEATTADTTELVKSEQSSEGPPGKEIASVSIIGKSADEEISAPGTAKPVKGNTDGQTELHEEIPSTSGNAIGVSESLINVSPNVNATYRDANDNSTDSTLKGRKLDDAEGSGTKVNDSSTTHVGRETVRKADTSGVGNASVVPDIGSAGTVPDLPPFQDDKPKDESAVVPPTSNNQPRQNVEIPLPPSNSSKEVAERANRPEAPPTESILPISSDNSTLGAVLSNSAGVTETVVPIARYATDKGQSEVIPKGPTNDSKGSQPTQDVLHDGNQTKEASSANDRLPEKLSPSISISINKPEVHEAQEDKFVGTGGKSGLPLGNIEPGVVKLSANVPGKEKPAIDIKNPRENASGPLIQVKGHSRGSIQRQVVRSYETEGMRGSNKVESSLVDELMEQFGDSGSEYPMRSYPRESRRRRPGRFRQDSKMRRRQSDGDEPFETDTTRDPFQDLPNQEPPLETPSHFNGERDGKNVLDGKLVARHKKLRHRDVDNDYSYEGALRWKLLEELDSILDPRNAQSYEQTNSKRQVSSQGGTNDDDMDEWRRRVAPVKVQMEMQSGENLVGPKGNAYTGNVMEEDERLGYRKYRRQGPLVGQGYDTVERPIVKDPLIHQPKKRFWIERQQGDTTAAPVGGLEGPLTNSAPAAPLDGSYAAAPVQTGNATVQNKEPQLPVAIPSGNITAVEQHPVGPSAGNVTANLNITGVSTTSNVGFSVVMAGRDTLLRGGVPGRRAARARRLRGGKGVKKAKKLKDTEGLKILRSDEMSADEDDDDDDDGDDDDDDDEDDEDKDSAPKKVTVQAVTAKGGQVGRVDAAERPMMSFGERMHTEPTKGIETKKDIKSSGNIVGNSESPDCVPDTLRAHTDYCRGIYTKHQMSIEEAKKLPSKKTMACYKLESIKGCLSAGSYFSKCIGSNNNEFQDLQGSVMNQMRELRCSACAAYSSVLITLLAMTAVYVLGRNF